MPDLLTWDEVHRWWIETSSITRTESMTRRDQWRSMNTIRALAQKLADMDCPACHGVGMSRDQEYRIVTDCPRCSGFPEGRKGKFAIDESHAINLIRDEKKKET